MSGAASFFLLLKFEKRRVQAKVIVFLAYLEDRFGTAMRVKIYSNMGNALYLYCAFLV